MTYAIVVVSVVFSVVALVLAFLSVRINARTERTYRRMEERERGFYGR